MAIVTGTTSTYSVGTGGGNREDLSNTIYDLHPDETYCLTNLDKTSATATLHEWLGDDLAAPGANIGLEGDEAAFATITNAARYSNRTQIFKKTFIVSGTQEVVNKAGRRKEISRQAVKKMRELKNDVEYALVSQAISTAGSASVGRTLAGIEAWLGATAASASAATTVVLATSTAGASTPPIASGAPGTAITDGTTTGALTEAKLLLALEAGWAKGGDPSIILTSASVKSTINSFTGVATRNVEIGKTSQAVITGAADVYVSSFGVHKIVLHRHVRTSVCLCIDPAMWAVSTLRPFMMEPLAKTGDAEKRQLLFEGTLEARNWKANAKVVAIA